MDELFPRPGLANIYNYEVYLCITVVVQYNEYIITGSISILFLFYFYFCEYENYRSSTPTFHKRIFHQHNIFSIQYSVN